MRSVVCTLVLALGIIACALSVTGVAAAAPPGLAQIAAGSQRADSSQTTVTVVHGLRGVVADISLDGEDVLKGFAPERATETLAVPAGSHRVTVRPAGSDTSTTLIDTTVDVAAGMNTSLVVHRGVDGAPTLTAYPNSAAALPAGQGRVVLRNTSDLATAQFLVDGQALAAVGPGGEQPSEVADGSHSIAVRSEQGDDILAPQAVSVPAGASTAVYLIGAQGDSSLGLLVETLNVAATPPKGVPAGDSGLKTPNVVPAASLPVAVAVLLAFGLVLVAARQRVAR